MTARVPLVIVSGSVTELPEGDSLSASVAVSPGLPRQLLQTNAGGTQVEWTSDIAVSGSLSVGVISSGIWQGTPIADTYLETISTAGKVSNSATTATSANTASAIVARDSSGDFSAGTITASLAGNASTATTASSCTGNSATATSLSSARTFALTGDVTGSVSSDLTSGASISTSIAAGSIVDADVNASAAIADTKLATISTAGKVSNSATTATSANTASAIVARDSSGDFSAGTITASLAGNASTATTASSCTGNSATATSLSSARTFALTGDVTGSVSSDLTSGASISTSIAAGSIVDADVNASAAIAGTKISPNFGAQAVVTTSSVTGNTLIPTGNTAPTNGIYLPATNTVAVATSGTGRVFVDVNGRFGVGTQNPGFTGATNQAVTINAATGRIPILELGVNGTSVSYLYNNTSVTALNSQTEPIAFEIGATEVARLTPSGNFGVGTNVPTELLELNKTDGAGNIGVRLHQAGQVEYSIGINDSDDKLYITNTNGGTGIGSSSSGIIIDFAGNVSAPGGITASLAGNASTATSLSSARTFALTGDVTGSVSSDLTSGASISTSIAAGSIVDADVNASAAIAGTKISPDFGSQTIITTGTSRAGLIAGGATTSPSELLEISRSNGGGNVGIRFLQIGQIEYKMGINDSDDLLYITNNNGDSAIGASTAGILVNFQGDVGINVSPSYKFQVSVDSAAKPSTNTWTISSDERLKQDIEIADLELCYEAVKNIPLKRFTWKDEVYTEEQVRDRKKLGWIAQDVQKVFPKAVNTTEFKYGPEGEFSIENCLDLNADQLYASMYGAVQKLIEKVEFLEKEFLKT